MAEITRYVLVDRQDNEGDWEYDKYDEAVKAAGNDHAVIQRTYVYDDSELVWTPNGRDSWPPKGRTRLK